MNEDLGERVRELETQLAHIHVSLGDMSDMIARQWTVIDRLEADNTRLKAEVMRLKAGTEPLPPQERPPHY